MKKFLAVLLAGLMVISMMACGGSGETKTTAGTTKAAEATTQGTTTSEPASYPKLRINITSFSGEAPAAVDQVTEALNVIFREKAGCEIEFVTVGFATMKEQLNLLLTGGEDTLDILSSFWYAPIGQLVSNGQVMAIDDVLKSSGQGILELFEDYQVILDCGKVNGKQYGIPTYTAWSSPNIYLIYKDVADKAGVTFEGNVTLDELTEMLIKCKKASPEAYFIPASSEPYWVPKGIDYLGDTNYMGVLLDPTKDTTVTNYFESDYFMNFVDNIDKWVENDLMYPDGMSNSNPTLQSFNLGLTMGTPGYGYNMENTIYEANYAKSYTGSIYGGTDIAGVEIGDRLLTTGNVNTYLWHITSFCKYPEQAMKVLNLLYTDATTATIFSNGIEGVNYRLVNGLMDYLEGQDRNSAGWSVGYSYANPHDFLCPAYVWQLSNANELMAQDNAKAIASLALGFVCDLTPVSDQYGACSNVFAQYYTAIMNGETSMVPEFQKALKDAGLEDVITEKQKQLNDWLANK